MTELIKHTNHIYQYFDMVSSNVCDEISSLIEKSKFYSDFEIMNSSRNKFRNNSSLNITQLTSFDENIMKCDELIHEEFSKCHKQYFYDNKKWMFALKSGHYNNMTCKYIYRHYNKSDNYEWHVDKTEKSELVASYILYLNDNFTGGDTLFLDSKLRVVPKKGSMLCFPCGIQTVHKGSKIQSGTKKIIWTCMENNYS